MQMLQTREQEPGPVMSAAERELQDFSYIVAHDLATEFRHVAAFARLLIDEADAEAVRAHADIIWQSSTKCQRMLSALMDYSAVQSHKLTPRHWPARSVVERAIAELTAQGVGKGAQFEIDVSGQVFADARLLIMAMRLALLNALAAAPDGMSPRIVLRGATGADGAWIVDIADNGEGLAREYWEKAFAMFWRLDPDAPGIGAGLPTLRRIVRRHGGEARFLEAGGGAILQITLPGAEAGQ